MLHPYKSWYFKQKNKAKFVKMLKALIIILYVPAVFPQDINPNIQSTPTLEGQNADLTTIILINHESGKKENYGKFINSKPELGVLKKNAKTFVQEGITTAYTTEVVGTTLVNGQLYAQYIKKNSRILYKSPSALTSWVGENYVSTDTIANLTDIFANEQQENQNIVIDDPDILRLKDVSPTEETPLFNTSFNSYQTKPKPYKLDVPSEYIPITVDKINAKKVVSNTNLTTFTIKSNFTYDSDPINEIDRVPKEFQRSNTLKKDNIYNDLENQPKNRILATTTYYGFSEFTTMVGDSIIIFQPSSKYRPDNKASVTSISGAAILKELQSFSEPYAIKDSLLNIITPTTTFKHIIQVDEQSKSQIKASDSDNQNSSDEPVKNIHTLVSVSEKDQSIDFLSDSYLKNTNELVGATTVFTYLDPFRNFDENIKTVTYDNRDTHSSINNTTDIDIDISTEEEYLKQTKYFNSLNTVINISTDSKDNSKIYFKAFENNTEQTPSQMTSKEFEISNCIRTSQIFLTQIQQLKTEIAENTKNTEKSVIDLIPSLDISEATKYYCIQPTTAQRKEQSSSDKELFKEIQFSEYIINNTDIEKNSTENENLDVFEYNPNYNEVFNNNDSFEEIEVLHKTLYTTYTYFTTFFEADTSSLSSHTEIISNIITSSKVSKTTDGSEKSLHFKSKQPEPMLQGTRYASQVSKFVVPTILENYVRSSEIDSIMPNEFATTTIKNSDSLFITKTYYTTYTFYTTIFEENRDETNSHTEVFSSIVTSPIKMNSSDTTSKELLITTPTSETFEKTLISMYYDTKSSNSEVDKRVLKQSKEDENEYPEDQISSESNIEETFPSATLLLQTSFTTYTYFTTIYGTSETTVQSRLETATNIVTETITLSPTTKLEESGLPITYYTTFTYWTKLTQNGYTSTLSSEKTVTNIIQPTKFYRSEIMSTENPTKKVVDKNFDFASQSLGFLNSEMEVETILQPTTFFTTYTYYTTLYDQNRTVTNVETVSNIVTPTSKDISTIILNTGNYKLNELKENVAKFKFFELKKIIDSENVSTIIFTTKIIPTIDNIGFETDIITSTSQFFINPKQEYPAESQQIKATTSEDSVGKYLKTGLIRLIEGTRIANETTTLYQSKVLGTFIDSRYAQIIESTSSFIFDEKSTVIIEPTRTNPVEFIQATILNVKNITLNQTKVPEVVESIKNHIHTPLIRPFSAKSRASFGPKKENEAPIATIYTRNDFTPTITATPALKYSGRNLSTKRVISSSPISGSYFSSVLGRRSRPNRNYISTQQTLTSSSYRNNFSSNRKSSIFKPTFSGSSRTNYGISVSQSNRHRSKTALYANSDSQNRNSNLNSGEVETEVVLVDADFEVAKTKTENPRQNKNPLLKFRRPINRQSGTKLSFKTNGLTTSENITSTAAALTGTSNIQSRKKIAVNSTQLSRSRPISNIFPPRQFLKNTSKLNSSNTRNYNSASRDIEYEGNESGNKYRAKRQTLNATFDKYSYVRSKRNTNTTSRNRGNFRNRFRTPKQNENISTTEVTTTSISNENSNRRQASRFTSKYLNGNIRSMSITIDAETQNRNIRPSRPGSNRSQFTLREKEHSSFKKVSKQNNNSLRRIQNPLSSRRPSTFTQNRRYLNHSNHSNSSSKSRSKSTNARQRNINSRSKTHEHISDTESKSIDGIITVTHFIPMQATIPLVKGKSTEYKQILTASPSIEILLPHQYTNVIGPNGQKSLIISRESKSINFVGATEITQFVLHESLTNVVTFTPTTIRGRKTSFSHIIPSTAYSVETITSTQTPQFSANAPFANILLSQLLLGNIGIPNNPLLPTLSPLGQLFPLAITPTQTEPITEYNTRTTTYVTTIYEGMSTVLPVTFQGKKILTTIFDTSAQTITATEFITDTTVITPTQTLPNINEGNTLLIKQLLLQQQLQQQFDQQAYAKLLATPTPSSEIIRETEESSSIDSMESDMKPLTNNKQKKKKQRKSNKQQKTHDKEDSAALSLQPKTSVITLYVSGRRPGDFSTVLSTVEVNNELTIRKRDISTTPHSIILTTRMSTNSSHQTKIFS